MGFSLDMPALLTSIGLSVARPEGESGNISLQLFSDSGGTLSVVEQWQLPLPASQGANAGMLVATSATQPLLQANALYFLWAHSGSPSSSADVIWPWNNAGVQGTIRQVGLTNQTFVGTLSAFQVNGELSPIPEPGTMLLLGTGAAFLVQRVRERRRV